MASSAWPLASYCGLWIFHSGAVDEAVEEAVVIEESDVVEMFEKLVAVLWLLLGRDDVLDFDMMSAVEEVAIGQVRFGGFASIFEEIYTRNRIPYFKGISWR
jgi:hypothetical protein